MIINNSSFKTKRSERNYIVLLVFTIFYSAMYSSSLLQQRFTTPILNYIRYGLIAVMFFTYLYRLVFINTNKREWIIAGVLMIFLLYAFMFNYGFAIIPLIVTCAFASFLNSRQIIYSYALGLLFEVICVILLCLFGILPMKINIGLTTYGFGNPNALGSDLALIFMSFLYLSWRKVRFWFLILYLIVIIFNFRVIYDQSAAICMLIYFLLYLIRHHIKVYNLIGLIGILSPTILTILSLLFAYLYGNFDWVDSINHLLTERVYTWNYYLNLSGLHIFPHRLDIIHASEYELNFLGGNADAISRGFFDGGYMFLLLRIGLIGTILIITLLAYYFNQIRKYKQVSLELLILIFILYTFSETEWIAPYGFCVSYLLVICFSRITDLSKNKANSKSCL